MSTKADVVVHMERLDDKHAKITLTSRIGELLKKILVLATERVVYPTEKFIGEVNETSQTIFEEEGIYGLLGIRDENLLEYIVNAVPNSEFFGEDRQPTILRKAADYWWLFAHYQVFNNGNKRTGLLVASIFINLNFMKIHVDAEKMYQVSKEIANGKMNKNDVYNYLLEITSFDYQRLVSDYIKHK